jgi:hypothetical protein
VKRWSRLDQLSLEGLLWVLPGVAVLDVLRQLVLAARGDALVSTGRVPEELVPATEVVVDRLSGTVVVEDPSTAQYAWGLVPELLGVLLAVVAARLLLGLVRSLRTGDPFTVVNARRLTALGALAIVGGVCLSVVQGISHSTVLAPLVPDEGAMMWEFDLPLWPALVGLFIGFLAEVLNRAVRLREDVEGLV